MISVFLLYFVHPEVEFHLSQSWDGLFFSWEQVWYKKDHQLVFQNHQYPGCMCHNLLRCTPAIVVEGCILPSIICFESCHHQFHSLLCFHWRILHLCGIFMEDKLIIKLTVCMREHWEWFMKTVLLCLTLLKKDMSFSTHDRNIQQLALEMYKVAKGLATTAISSLFL